jgi:hypothetical protein
LGPRLTALLCGTELFPLFTVERFFCFARLTLYVVPLSVTRSGFAILAVGVVIAFALHRLAR